MSYPTELVSGTLVDRRYKIQKTLGQGGFGRTYLVFDEKRFNQPCVLKEFTPKATQKHLIQKSRQLFEREAWVLHQLDCPQIPKFFGWFEEQNRLFLVQDYVDGKTYKQLLQERQKQGKIFTEEEVILWLKDLLPVLDYIHSRQIIHRDISPENIMLPVRGDRPVLIDFGVVNQKALKPVDSSSDDSFIVGTTVGKLGYAPIEQVHQGKCYPNSDLYSLAVTALVLLSGKQPDRLFDSEQMNWQWQEHIQVSEHLAEILDKMLAAAPLQRYQSAGEVLKALSSSPVTLYLDRAETTFQSLSEQGDRIKPRSSVATVLTDNTKNSSAFFKLRSKNKPLMLSLLTILLLGGLAIGINSQKFVAWCHLLGNCSNSAHSEEKPARTTQENSNSSNSSSSQTLPEETDIFTNPNQSTTPYPPDL